MRFRKILMTYLTVYLLIFVLFACVMLPLGENMQRLARARIEEENRTRIANGENYLENQMNKYVQTASQLSVNTDFLSLARAKENEAAADKAVYMLRVKKQLHYLLGLLDHVDGCILSFGQNAIFLSDEMVALDYKTVYGPLLQIGAWNVEDFAKARLSDTVQSVACLPEEEMRLNSQPVWKKRLIFQVHGASNKNICTFLFLTDAQAFFRACLPGLQEEGGFALLLGAEGQRLTSLGDAPETDTLLSLNTEDMLETGDGRRYVLFRAPGAPMGLTLISGVPEERILENTNLLMGFIPVYLIVGVVSSILLCLLYALWHYRSIRALVSTSMQLSQIPYQNTNAYRYARSALKQIADEKERLTQEYSLLDEAYLSGMITAACVHGVYTRQETEELRRYLGDLPLYYVAVLKYAEHTEPDALLKTEESVRRFVHEAELIFVHQNPRKTILLICGGASSLRKNAAAALTQCLQEGERGAAGLSDGLTGAEMLRLGYQQASQALRIQKYAYAPGAVALYQQEEEQAPALLDLPAMNKISDLIYSCKRDGIRAFFAEMDEAIHNNAGMAEEQFREAFYALRMVMQNIALELKLEFPKPHLRPDMPFSAGVEALLAAALGLTDKIDARQQRAGEEMCRKILSTLETGLADPALNAAAVAQRVGCSEKYVFRLVKEGCGRSFGDQLELLRIQRAEALLLEGRLNNEQIAQAAGFASLTTFYRAFRKAHGLSPAVWRSIRESMK